MTDRDMLEARMGRLEQRTDRMTETLATKEDIKLLHDRLNNLTMLVVGIGFLNIVAVVTVRLLS